MSDATPETPATAIATATRAANTNISNNSYKDGFGRAQLATAS